MLGMEDDFSVERKSMSDLLGSLTQERDRFMREIQRLRAYAVRLLLVVGTGAELTRLLTRRRVSCAAIQGSLAALEARGIPVAFYPTPERAAERVEAMAVYAWRNKMRGIVGTEIPDWARLDMARRMQAGGALCDGKEVTA